MSNRSCTPGAEIPFEVKLVYDFSDFNATYPLLEYPVWELAVKGVFYLIALLIDLIGNSTIILIIALNRRMRTTTNVLILNLAVSDIFVGVFCMWVHMGNQIDTNYPFGAFMCKFSIFTQVMSVTASALTLTVISIERFIAIVYPFKARWSTATIIIIIVSTWAAAIATAAPYLHVTNLVRYMWFDREERVCYEIWKKYYDSNCKVWYRDRVIYYCIVSIVMFFTPVFIMLVTYTIIAVKLLTRRAPGSLITTTSSAQDKAKKKVTRMLFAVFVIFILCWTPQQTFLLKKAFTNDQPSLESKYVAVFFAYFNSSLNPILYGGFNENFRRGFKEAFKCLLVKKRNKIGIDSTARSMAPNSKIFRDPPSCAPKDESRHSGATPVPHDHNDHTAIRSSNTLLVPLSTTNELHASGLTDVVGTQHPSSLSHPRTLSQHANSG